MFAHVTESMSLLRYDKVTKDVPSRERKCRAVQSRLTEEDTVLILGNMDNFNDENFDWV